MTTARVPKIALPMMEANLHPYSATEPRQSAPKVTTRRAVAKRPREHDTGHVITGFGYAFECSCGEHGRIVGSYREAMQAGREHAAAHTAHAS